LAVVVVRSKNRLVDLFADHGVNKICRSNTVYQNIVDVQYQWQWQPEYP